MVRKIKKVKPEVITDIFTDSCKRIGIGDVDKDKQALLLRLLISGIGSHFFFNPDTEIEIGYLKFKKSPNIDELFNVEIIRNKDEGVVNAETLYRYYRGEMIVAKELKKVIETFAEELVSYSQSQQNRINKLEGKLNLSKARSKKKGNK